MKLTYIKNLTVVISALLVMPAFGVALTQEELKTEIDKVADELTDAQKELTEMSRSQLDMAAINTGITSMGGFLTSIRTILDNMNDSAQAGNITIPSRNFATNFKEQLATILSSLETLSELSDKGSASARTTLQNYIKKFNKIYEEAQKYESICKTPNLYCKLAGLTSQILNLLNSLLERKHNLLKKSARTQ